MESEVLVDSNVFIDLMKYRGDPAPWLYRWPGIRNLVVCGIVRVEVLRGVKSPKAYSKLNNFMDVMVNVPASNRLWDEVAALAWKPLFGLDTADAAGRVREMLVIERYREGKLSRGQAAEMLGLGFHEAEILFKCCGATQQPTWDELEQSAQAFRSLTEA